MGDVMLFVTLSEVEGSKGWLNEDWKWNIEERGLSMNWQSSNFN